jgi:hypothetical protein
MENKVMKANHYYNQQNEYDYYDRQYEKKIKGCFFSFKAIVVIAVVFFIVLKIIKLIES